MMFNDLVMPGELDGVALARRVKDEYPDTAVLLTSGYAKAADPLEAGFPILLFFFKDPAPTDIYTLSLHDALPILRVPSIGGDPASLAPRSGDSRSTHSEPVRSEEYTSELQSHVNLVCRLLLE